MKTRLKIPNNEIIELLGIAPNDFPKYTTQIINLANQNSQGTRPAVVGQMSELIKEFTGNSIKEWEKWYLNKYPDAIENATNKIENMVENFRQAITKIDQNMIRQWAKDLVIVKTFIGLKFQEAILNKTAQLFSAQYRLATPVEESKGIDGFINEIPVSIKPESYKSKKSLSEKIQVSIIYYDKAKDGLTMDIEEIYMLLKNNN
ncbi:MAG TPA: MjaI family restriction endonuclease [bacterium]|nr:MjaI family restriction endonuclease [bacterium]HPN44168.1 MjaI family restriction endonuclease [bacterium]